MIDHNTYLEMLTYMRPAWSDEEEEFISRFIFNHPEAYTDGFGNVHVKVGESTTLFSSHTDTVHKVGGRQKIYKDETLGSVFTDGKTVLGADDATGCYIMLRMIQHGVPGYYIFHRAEERGGLGSAYLRDHNPELIKGFDRAIAFDRKGYDSVITHQMYRGASDLFAEALAKSLGGAYTPDSTGIFTDTENYAELIQECTNLSVGYFKEHTGDEWQNYRFLEDELLPKLFELKWETLPVARNVKDRGYSTPLAFPSKSSVYIDVEPEVLMDTILNEPDVILTLLTELMPVYYDDLDEARQITYANAQLASAI